MTNPLLGIKSSDGGFPRFNEIGPKHFLPAIERLVKECRELTMQTLKGTQPPSWESLFAPIEEINDRLEQAWAVVSHLNGVINSPEVRDAHGKCLPILTDYSTWVGQLKPLFNACLELKKSDQFSQLSTAQTKVVENQLRDFKLAGVNLSDEGQKHYAKIKKRLAELSTEFSNNILDASESFSRHLESADQLAGLPPSSLSAAKILAESKGLDGYLITLDIPSYLPVMQYCQNRELREELYYAYVTRASELGPNAGQWDNSAIMEEILKLRQELAILLGYKNYAELSMATKMASSVSEAISFIESLAEASVDIAKTEYGELAMFAKNELDISSMKAWDVPFVSEALRLDRYDLSQEAPRPYFPADTVIAGMFQVVHRLYDIDISLQKAPSQWHDEVRFYEIKSSNKTIAFFYLDLFAREGKRSGAWMADARVRREDSSGCTQLPVAFLTCNFTPPLEDKPALLTHNEVATLFHEFGHGLHHMLTSMDRSAVSGINGVAWDAVELPSQFMENWCWEAEALQLYSGHYQTSEPLPTELLNKMLAARNFLSGMQMVRQLELALFDLELHENYGSDNWLGIQQTLSSVRAKVSAHEVPDFNRFQHAFGHIFAGGYAAGYYSYKWAEVLSADAFSLFEENGIFDRETGQRFLSEILAKGGSEEPAVLFNRFRGRAPDTAALLRHSGIAG